MTDLELINKAKALVNPIQLSRLDMDAATVGCALISAKNTLYTGVCIHLSCGLGFCAEHAAVADMIKSGETEIATIVACNEKTVLPPCGRCREMMVQVNLSNFHTRVIVNETEAVELKELLPLHWMNSEHEN